LPRKIENVDARGWQFNHAQETGDRTHRPDGLGCHPLHLARYAWALDLGKLLDNIESDNVNSIDVAGLVALMADKNSHVFVYDVDPVSDREKMGVIPGALVLSDWNKFDLATELPKDKNSKLVFYCHNWL
jgi:hypothetical protein